MLIQPYQLDELQFAYCHRIYFRTHTRRRRPIQSLPSLTTQILQVLLEPFHVHPLQFAATEQEITGLLSLLPSESISIALSKIKGRISKWISTYQDPSEVSTHHKNLGKGYFAATVGQPTTDSIEAYLDKQAEHHGYANRARPPIWVKRFSHAGSDRQKLMTGHAHTVLRYHLVFATFFRRGVFTDVAARKLTECWRSRSEKFLIDKVSFVPDHVHLAVSIHPTHAPSDVAVSLMNVAQEFIWSEFPKLVIQAKVDRLWQPSAYVGSFGDLTCNAISAYMKNWMEMHERDFY